MGTHPFDDKDLTFGDLKKIIENGLGGKLNREDNVTEKLDGQNPNGKLEGGLMAITLDVSVGDTILGGRFKNKKIKVKKIGKDEHGMPTINGRKVVNFRILKVDEKIIRDKDGYGKYEKPDDSDFDEPSKTKNESNYKKMMEIIK